MTDFDFTLNDRIQKIQSMNEQYNLLNNSFVSISGGKDSTILSHLIDIALPKNKIPRVFFNTGLEHKEIIDFIKESQKIDNRIIVVASKVDIKKMQVIDGLPFKSKYHSNILSVYQNSGVTKSVAHYLSDEFHSSYSCPKILRYQFSQYFTMKVSSKCCDRLKKEVSKKWQEENKIAWAITGIRMAEGGLRGIHGGCMTTIKRGLYKFHPLKPLDDKFIQDFIDHFKIHICKLYHEPFNFKRTGCIGCPFNVNLEQDLKLFLEYMPQTAKRAYLIWKDVYEEYARIGYRLSKDTLNKIKSL